MKLKFLPPALLVIGLVILLAFRAAHRADDARRAHAAMAGQTRDLRAKIGALETRLATQQKAAGASHGDSASASAEILSTSAGPKPASGSTNEASPLASPRLSPLTRIANDPVKLAAYLKNFRAQLDLSYGGMFKALALSPEQIEKFKDVEVELDQARMGLQAAIEAQGVDRNSDEARKLWADYNKLRSRRKTEFFGALAERYMEYYHTEGVRSVVRKLAAPDFIPGETITSALVERATDVLVANAQRRPAGAYGVDFSTVNWPAAREQLKEMLSLAQIETLGLFFAQAQAQTREMQLRNRLTAEFRRQTRAQ